MCKKSIFTIIILMMSLLLVTACGKRDKEMTSDTTSEIKVIDKGFSEDKKELWIKGYDPNNQKESDVFKLIIKQNMGWNLIEKNRIYLASYTRRNNNKSLPAEVEDLWISQDVGHQ